MFQSKQAKKMSLLPVEQDGISTMLPTHVRANT